MKEKICINKIDNIVENERDKRRAVKMVEAPAGQRVTAANLISKKKKYVERKETIQFSISGKPPFGHSNFGTAPENTAAC